MKRSVMKMQALFFAVCILFLITGIRSDAEEMNILQLPSDLMTIAEEAFAENTSLQKVVIPFGAEHIGARAFADSSVESIQFPGSITFVDPTAFSGCTSLREISVIDEEKNDITDAFLANIDIEEVFADTLWLEHYRISMEIEISASQDSCYRIGKPITWTANAQGGAAPYSYSFTLFKNDELIESHSYSSSAEFTYTPDEIGNYYVNVLVRDQYSRRISMPSVPISVDYAILSLAITSQPSELSYTGDTLTWSVAAAGGKAPYQYSFELYDGDICIASSIDSDSSEFTYPVSEIGSYTLTVTVTDDNGRTEIITSDSVEVQYGELKVRFETEPTDGISGEELEWSVIASGGMLPYQYRYVLYRDITIIRECTYDFSSEFWMTLPEPGAYVLTVYAMDGLENVKSLTRAINVSSDQPQITEILCNAEELETEDDIIWSIQSSGGFAPYSFTYQILCDNVSVYEGTEQALETVEFTPETPGQYALAVTITDSRGSTGTARSTDVIVNSAIPHYRALLIGNTYESNNSLTNLSGCTVDATSMAGMLGSMTATPYACTTGFNKTVPEIKNMIFSTFGAAKSTDVSLFYFSGHGYSGSGKLVGEDGSSISFAELRSVLDMIPGKKIVILDSCYSGNAINKSISAMSMLESEASDFDFDSFDLYAYAYSAVSAFADFGYLKSGELVGNEYYVICACRKDQTSMGAASGSSIFTFWFEYACGWHADRNSPISVTRADADGDGFITLHEAYTGTEAYLTEYRTKYPKVTQITVVNPENSSFILWGK